MVDMGGFILLNRETPSDAPSIYFFVHFGFWSKRRRALAYSLPQLSGQVQVTETFAWFLFTAWVEQLSRTNPVLAAAAKSTKSAAFTKISMAVRPLLHLHLLEIRAVAEERMDPGLTVGEAYLKLITMSSWRI